MMQTDHTHDAARRSWVESANIAGIDFPIQNLPLGVFSIGAVERRCGVAIGDQILDLFAAAERGLFSDAVSTVVKGQDFEALFAAGRPLMRALRHEVFSLLDENSANRDTTLLRPMAECSMHLPTKIRSFTDFFVGIHHAIRCGEIMAGPQYQLPPNYHVMPLGYNGRGSTVVVSGTDIRRPTAMRKRLEQDPEATFGPCQWFDFELEMGFFVGPGNAMGEPISVTDAEDHVVGYCLLNDWSARDIQMFEMAPLGAFNSKSVGTSISPWIVTADALVPFRIALMERMGSADKTAPYLRDEKQESSGGISVALSATISTAKMREAGQSPVPLLKTHARYLYWTCAQMLAQHSVTGCSMTTGDLIGTGTVSGPTRADLASFFELSFAGRDPIELPNGEQRSFIEDGDEITFFGRCDREGFASIGFGQCAGRVLEPLKAAFS
jgi:fumarylacetoacetase